MRWGRQSKATVNIDPLRDQKRALLDQANQFDEAFRLTRQISSLRDAAQRWLDLADVLSDEDPIRAEVWHQAGLRYLEAYQHVEDQVDLSVARQLLSDAVEATGDDNAVSKGMMLTHLGHALRLTFEVRDDTAFLDEAEAVLERAVDLLSSIKPSESARVSAGMGLAQVLRDRYRLCGDSGRIDRALELDEAALVAASNPEVQTLARNGLANSLALRWERTRDTRDLDRLVVERAKALETTTPGSPHYSGYLSNLANAYASRAEATGSKADFDRAVKIAEEALSVTAPSSPTYTAKISNLAGMLRDRYDLFGEVADADRALDLSKQALEASPEGGDLWLSAANNVGIGLRERFSRQNSLDDLETAISLLTQAATRTPSNAPEATARWHNLGNAMRARYLRSEDPGDLGATIAAYEHALSLTEGAHQAALLLNNLGSAYNDRYDIDTSAPGRKTGDDLDRAKECYARAAKIVSPETSLWRSVRSNQGRAILADPLLRTNSQALDEAARAFSAAIEKTPGLTPELLIYQINMAKTELLRYRATDDAAALSRGTALLRTVTEVGVDVAPDQGLLAAKSWGGSAMERQEWQEAAEAYRAGLVCLRALRDRQSRRDQKETWLHHAVTMAPRAAYCLARVGDLTGAVAAAEAGRGVLLVEALEARTVAENISSEGTSEEDLAAVITLTAPTGPASFAGSSALVFLVCGPSDGRALLVREDGPPSALVLPGFGEADALDRLRVYQAAYDRQLEDAHTWRSTLEDVTGWLWTAGIGDLCQQLNVDRATLIPSGPLSLLPLHAAWRPEGDMSGQGDGRRYAMEDILFSYAPNARMMHRTREVPPVREADGVLVVADPQPSEAPPLPYAAEEGERVRRLFKDGLVLSGRTATRSSVWEALSAWPVLHFACHGYADAVEPLMSSLLMAGDEPIRVREILADARLQARLVVLSACETAVVGSGLPDEVVGLPTAFIQAGVGGVVATWWPVYDESTARLMEGFYTQLRRRLDDPAEALRLAQLQMRAFPEFRHPVHWAGVSYFGG
ncbi:CHAT domain-containing tetratricopeptide repeat protein [Ornithinimicrobium cerasi]|uniref:Tetratricopeptide repeat-containing protein n=1 Tax=Ornithinimicrobium cerasi TaxID=2248773 RepID=A0A285VAT8_9MICO|nr:CHAT domain-containing protein [Ornithinimicrobium cerasi]SOC51209.1 Tetratricopeptide repeat-containing protein [Ornithinimicrobium cerasi]